jgi:hypothetical protein
MNTVIINEAFDLIQNKNSAREFLLKRNKIMRTESPEFNELHLKLYFRLRMKDALNKIEKLGDEDSIELFALHNKLLYILEDAEFFSKVHGLKIFTTKEINKYNDILLKY